MSAKSDASGSDVGAADEGPAELTSTSMSKAKAHMKAKAEAKAEAKSSKQRASLAATAVTGKLLKNVFMSGKKRAGASVEHVRRSKKTSSASSAAAPSSKDPSVSGPSVSPAVNPVNPDPVVSIESAPVDPVVSIESASINVGTTTTMRRLPPIKRRNLHPHPRNKEFEASLANEEASKAKAFDAFVTDAVRASLLAFYRPTSDDSMLPWELLRMTTSQIG